jgi:hypothetical protein
MIACTIVAAARADQSDEEEGHHGERDGKLAWRNEQTKIAMTRTKPSRRTPTMRRR